MKKKKNDPNKLLGAMLVFSIPLMIICITSGLFLRLPDIYQYNLSSTQALSETTIVVEEEDIVSLISNYMKGKTDKFSLKEDLEYKPEDLFNSKDQELMGNIRFALNIILIIGALMFIATAIGYFFLIRWRKKEIHMHAYKKSIVVFIGILIISSLTKVITPIRNITWGKLLDVNLAKDDFLVYLFGDSLSVQIVIFEGLIACILMAILGYITWEIAGRKRLFKRF